MQYVVSNLWVHIVSLTKHKPHWVPEFQVTCCMLIVNSHIFISSSKPCLEEEPHGHMGEYFSSQVAKTKPKEWLKFNSYLSCETVDRSDAAGENKLKTMLVKVSTNKALHVTALVHRRHLNKGSCSLRCFLAVQLPYSFQMCDQFFT